MQKKKEIKWPPKSGWVMVVVAERWIEVDENEVKGIRLTPKGLKEYRKETRGCRVTRRDVVPADGWDATDSAISAGPK